MNELLTSQGYYDDKLSLDDATTFLRLLLNEFPFSDWYDDPAEFAGGRQSRSQAVQVMAMLSQFGRGLVPRGSLGMGFVYNSNSQRSGKSLLAKIAVVPVNGKMATQTWNSKDEELRKIIDAEMLRAARYIIFDNVRGHLSSPVIEALITSASWTGRMLGKTQMFEVANTATVFITGNDITVSSDMAHRALTVDLFVEEANVQERKVLAPIDDAWLMTKANRVQILSALWSIVRHWVKDGKPLATENLRNGFERWCEVFGGMVKYAGFGDGLAAPEVGSAEIDTTDTDMHSLVRTLAKELDEEGKKRVEFPFQDLVDLAHEDGLFEWLLDGKDKEGHYLLEHKSSARFGLLLRKYAPFNKGGRVFRLAADRSVKMFATGKNRHRRYVIDRI